MTAAKRAAAAKPPPLEPPKPRAKSNGNGAAPRKVSRAEAAEAVADLKNKPRKGVFRGVEFELPAMLPVTFAFDVGEMMADRGMDFGLIHRLMVGVITPESWRLVRDKIAADGVGIDQLEGLIGELFDAVMNPYGMDLGESSASTAT